MPDGSWNGMIKMVAEQVIILKFNLSWVFENYAFAFIDRYRELTLVLAHSQSHIPALRWLTFLSDSTRMAMLY